MSFAGPSNLPEAIGSSAFFPRLLSNVREATSAAGLPLDTVILQSILLCFISGDKHLILRTSEEDIPYVQRIAVTVSTCLFHTHVPSCGVVGTVVSSRPSPRVGQIRSMLLNFIQLPSMILGIHDHPFASFDRELRNTILILSSLFGIMTHKLRIRKPDAEPRHPAFRQTIASPFLRSLFLPGTPSSSSTLSSIDDPSTTGVSASKTEKRRSGSRSTTKRKSKHYSRSSSFANDLVNAQSLSPNTLHSDPFEDKPRSLSSTISGKETTAASNPFASGHSPTSPHSPTFLHSYLDSAFQESRDLKFAQIPNAVVLSGLENASLPSQKALVKVLAEKRVVLDSQELEVVRSSTHGREKTQPMGSGSLYDDLEDEKMDGVWNLPDGFMLIYVCPMNTRERPAIHKTLLDRFSMSATVRLAADVRALCKHPYIAPVFTSTPIPQTLIHDLRAFYHQTHFPAQLRLYLSDLFTATRHHHELDGMWLTARSMQDAEDLARASRVLGCDPTGMELIREAAAMGETSTHPDEDEDEDKFFDVMDEVSWGAAMDMDGPKITDEPVPVLDVSEADIARITPRVMTHRLRVGDVDDDIFYGVMSGAASMSVNNDERPTVKSILIQILAEV
ncbi:uncharacterized protein BT62DRAFT_1076228 [Guyanagaster necrorhizus]|uniref:Uncharacterized protein n=1 Tax=Guyanagaster necrorhizus TaxID=856835 RepID=A0A9P8AST9_9AGAR|nr:uncharacterized protein BT62DRAFT_1076228 [Guyanagaster necrorhizus MCA 3950]KAG7446689.1 hypothetical protein BT62DRAFT_1076228 [Guyanagaster necrorhizus MCA 3950]